MIAMFPDSGNRTGITCTAIRLRNSASIRIEGALSLQHSALSPDPFYLPLNETFETRRKGVSGGRKREANSLCLEIFAQGTLFSAQTCLCTQCYVLTPHSFV